MITHFAIKRRLEKRKQDLDKLDRAYVNWAIGDEEYNQKRPMLLGQIEELEDILCMDKK